MPILLPAHFWRHEAEARLKDLRLAAEPGRKTAAAIDACEACSVPLAVSLELEWVLRSAHPFTTRRPRPPGRCG